jgi:Ca2+-binding EF-hand superfamily protein
MNTAVSLMKPPESWFQKVDRDGDGMIDSIELAAHLKKYSIRCSMDFFNELAKVA